MFKRRLFHKSKGDIDIKFFLSIYITVSTSLISTSSDVIDLSEEIEISLHEIAKKNKETDAG
jgi:hypothetical protein